MSADIDPKSRPVYPVPKVGDAIEVRHSTQWQRGTVKRVDMVEGHAMVSAVVDGGGPSVASWWNSSYFRPLTGGAM